MDKWCLSFFRDSFLMFSSDILHLFKVFNVISSKKTIRVIHLFEVECKKIIFQ